jgi:hypothetical protein
MKREYLGDSFDAVKRLWQQLLQEWAPLYANPKYIPDDLHREFTLLTGIRMLPANPQMPFSILNDPDTGIHLPGRQNQQEGRTHISIASIVDQFRKTNAMCTVTFDQSNYRRKKLSLCEQRAKKMLSISDNGLKSFYYVSHAPFLFVTADARTLMILKNLFLKNGIPGNRLEEIQ